MEPTGSNTVFHVSDTERSIVGNERRHSGFPESVGSHVVSGNAEGPRSSRTALMRIRLNIVSHHGDC